jgi:DNA-binding response OmpR family regulator
MATILLAEDEVVLGKLVKEALERKSFHVIWAKDGQEAYDLYCSHKPDLCILDVMMPAINGFVLASMIRNLSTDIPLLFLTARSETTDVIKGFESGGNDYLKKPFSLDELMLRIKELLRRNVRSIAEPAASTEYFQIGKYQFSPVTQLLRSDEESFKLSHKESELLKSLISYKNTLMPRKETLMELWGDDSFFNSRTMDVYIARLRKYLKHDPSLSIVNIRGFGFKLIEENE